MTKKVRRREKTYLSLIIETLRKAGKPMHYKDITERVLPLHPSKAKIPEYTILSVLWKSKDFFVRVDNGTYTLSAFAKKK